MSWPARGTGPEKKIMANVKPEFSPLNSGAPNYPEPMTVFLFLSPSQSVNRGQRRETGRRNFWIAHASHGVLKETVHTVHKGKSVEPWGLQTLESCPSSCARPRLVETSLRMALHWYIGRWRYKLVQIISVKMCQIVEVAGRFSCMVEAMRSFGQLSKACWSFSMQKGSKGAAGNSGETHHELDVKAL